MKMAKIREMSDAELENSIAELSKERFNLKVQAKTGQLQNSARIKQVKTELARINTEITVRKSS